MQEMSLAFDDMDNRGAFREAIKSLDFNEKGKLFLLINYKY